MQSKILLSTLLVATVVGGSVFYVSTRPEPLRNASDTASTDSTKTVKNDSDTPSVSPTASPAQTQDKNVVEKGVYTVYSSDKVSSTKGTKLLFFHAPWCAQCRALEQDIQRSTIPDGVTIFKVDYDSNQSLRQKYGVTLQTTVVRINDSGELVSKYVAYDDPTLEALKSNLLE